MLLLERGLHSRGITSASPRGRECRVCWQLHRRPEPSRFGHTYPRVAFPSESCLGFSGSLWRRTNGVVVRKNLVQSAKCTWVGANGQNFLKLCSGAEASVRG